MRLKGGEEYLLDRFHWSNLMMVVVIEIHRQVRMVSVGFLDFREKFLRFSFLSQTQKAMMLVAHGSY